MSSGAPFATSFSNARPMTVRFDLIRTVPDINATATTGHMFGLNNSGGLMTRLEQALALLRLLERQEFFASVAASEPPDRFEPDE